MSPIVVPIGPSACTSKAMPARQDCSQFSEQTAFIPQSEPAEPASKTSHPERGFKVIQKVSVTKAGKEGRKVKTLARSARFPRLWVLAASAQPTARELEPRTKQAAGTGWQRLKTQESLFPLNFRVPGKLQLAPVCSNPWYLADKWALVSFYYQGLAMAPLPGVSVGQEVATSALSGPLTSLPGAITLGTVRDFWLHEFSSLTEKTLSCLKMYA